MRSLLLVFLSSSIILLSSADGTTPAPVEEVKTTPPAVEEVKSTAAPEEEVKSTGAPAEEAKATEAAVEEVKSTAAPASEEKVEATAAPEAAAGSTAAPAAEEEVKTTAAPVEEAKATEAAEEKKEAKNCTGQPKEKKPKFDKDLLSDAVIGDSEKKKRRSDLLKSVVKKMEDDGAITPEEVETVISEGEPILEKVEAAFEKFGDKFKKLVMPRENEEKAETTDEKEKPKKFVRPLVLPREGSEALVRPRSGAKPDQRPAEEKKFNILPFFGKSEKENRLGDAFKSSLEKLRAGRGLINIERIDKIDVTVYTYDRKQE